jgi:hypothetical protein
LHPGTRCRIAEVGWWQVAWENDVRIYGILGCPQNYETNPGHKLYIQVYWRFPWYSLKLLFFVGYDKLWIIFFHGNWCLNWLQISGPIFLSRSGSDCEPCEGHRPQSRGETQAFSVVSVGNPQTMGFAGLNDTFWMISKTRIVDGPNTMVSHQNS